MRISWLPVVFLATVALSAPAAAQWEVELAEQIEDVYDCKVSFLSQVIRREVEGHEVLMAKVHCEDKRTFDAYRGDRFDLFEFKACEDHDAKSC